jgi:hypothetical protein
MITGSSVRPLADRLYSTRGRHLGIDDPDDQAIRLQLTELRRQHALRHARHAAADGVEAQRAFEEVVEQDALPFAADKAERDLDRTGR